MMIGFFLAGFICFILGINLYLRAEDTQWHKTVGMIKTLTDMQISDKFKTDNVLQTVLITVDKVRMDHAMEVAKLQELDADRAAALKSQIVEVTTHLEHLRKENHKTQILLEATARNRQDDLDRLKTQADIVLKNVRAGATSKDYSKPKRKLIRAKRSRATH